MNTTTQLIAMLIASAVIVGCSSTPSNLSEPKSETMVPDTVMMKVTDQVAAKYVVIDELVLLTPAFVVIHADADGKPGEILGHSQALRAGTYRDITVDFDATKSGARVFAMLHRDDGNGAFEFPGPDTPMLVDGKMMIESINWK